MNRRQFLTGVSAIAVASALPAAPAMQAWGERITADDLAFALWNQRVNADRIAIQEIYWRGRRWWITGNDNVIHFSEPCDPDWRSFCATGEELG